MACLFLTLNLADLYFVGEAVLGFFVVTTTVLTGYGLLKKNTVKPIYNLIILPVIERHKLIVERRQLVVTLSATVSRLEENQQLLLKELKLNGGSSIKDAINRIENKLNSQIEKFEFYQELIQEAIFEMDGSGNVVNVNRKLCELINADVAEILGKNWIVRIVPGERERVLGEWRSAFENKCPVDSYQTIMLGDYEQGTSLNRRNMVSLRVQAIPRFDQQNNLVGFLGWINKLEN